MYGAVADDSASRKSDDLEEETNSAAEVTLPAPLSSKRENIAFSMAFVVVLFILGISMFHLNPGSSSDAFVKNKLSFNLIDSSTALSFFEELDEIGETNFGRLSEVEARTLFVGFSSKFERKQESESLMEKRYEIFKKNLALIDLRNKAERAAGGTAVHGLTKFCDIDPAELLSRLSLKPRTDVEKKQTKFKNLINFAAGKPTKKKADWTGVYTTPVRDQGTCGCCWSISTVTQVESDAIRMGMWDKNRYLSIQQLASCDPNSFGCEGGMTESALEYIAQNGLVPDKEWPFEDHDYISGQNVTTPCKAINELDTVISVADATYYRNEAAMIDHVLEVGPLSVGLDASIWFTYKSGIMRVCGVLPNHAVQAVGVNLEEGYWKIRNSWTDKWGEKGNIRLAVGFDTCHITDSPMFTVPARVRHNKGLSVKIVSLSDVLDKDVFGLSDPYVILKLGEDDHVTKVKQDNLNAVLNKEYKFKWNGVVPLDFEVWDSDPVLRDDPLGTLRIWLSAKEFPDDKTVHVVRQLENVKQGSITLDIRVNGL